MKKNALLILLYLTFFSLYSQVKEKTNSTNFKTITGVVFSNSSLLKNTNIKVFGTARGTTTDAKGNFTIKVKNHEILQFSHVGYKPLKILIEKVTKSLRIELKELNSLLDEVTIKTKLHKIKPITFVRMGYGFINVRASSYLEGKDLNEASSSIATALMGKFSGLKVRKNKYGDEIVILRNNTAAIWDVDGLISTTAPDININQIKRIAILKSLAETTLYGSEGAGGVIIVQTISNSDPVRNINAPDNPFTNKNYYEKDALLYDNIEKGNLEYLKYFISTQSAVEAFKVYKNFAPEELLKKNFHIDMANYFYKKYPNKPYATLILKDLEKLRKNNPKTLKSIAYTYQKLNLHKEALRVYKNLMQLNPNHAQSFRDLANTYVHLNQYKNAWKSYKYYLHKGGLIGKNNIGEIIAFEMKALSQLKKEKSNIIDKLDFTDLGIDTHYDVRLVFEWNTTDAEFSFEFVNPNKQSYVINHTLYKNNDLIIDEKLKGYNSKQYIISPLSKGNWFVNVNYFGNKTPKPTFLKVTSYYNWGEKNQIEKIDLFELSIKNTKMQLLAIDSEKIRK